MQRNLQEIHSLLLSDNMSISVKGKFIGVIPKHQGKVIPKNIYNKLLEHGAGSFWRHEVGYFGLAVPLDAHSWVTVNGINWLYVNDIYHEPFKRPGDGVMWSWNGNDEKASLNPSIGHPYWHGYLYEGNLICANHIGNLREGRLTLEDILTDYA